jgi:hypothetical protein
MNQMKTYFMKHYRIPEKKCYSKFSLNKSNRPMIYHMLNIIYNMDSSFEFFLLL